MAQVNRIRELFFEKGLKYAEISRVTGFDVKTVKKYIYQEDFNPMPKVQKPRPSKLEPYKKDIDAWLEEDKQYRKNSAIRPAESLIVWQRSIPHLTAPTV